MTAVAGIPGSPGTFYMGSTGGGVWKTADFGQTWKNVSDGYFQTPSIGAIRVAPSNSNVVYVGTGSDAIRSNVITGRGVYKSTDGGKTWQFLGLSDAGQIGAVLIDPHDPDTVFIAALGHAFGPSPDRGVYRSRDGGATWEKVLFVSDQTGAVDLEFAPHNPREVYASMWHGQRKPWTIISGSKDSGVYKSSDAGSHWKKLGGGLPEGLVGKSDLAVSAADPNRLYVLIEAPRGEGGLYRSDDRGRTFRRVSNQRGILDRPFYYTNVDADPTNADVVYINSTAFYKSEDGGATFKGLRTPHGDNHDMWINPADSRIFIQSNDGGATVTRDGGKTWSTQNNQPTAELYQVNVDDRFPYWVYAGQQDDSTIRVPSLPPYPPALGPHSFWEEIGGCETGPAVPKPGDPDIVYSNCKGRFGRYNARTGQEKQYYVGAVNMYGHNPADLKYRFQRVSPIFVSPHNPKVVYHASQYLHRSTDEGATWETISPDLTADEPSRQVISGEPITRDITGEEFYSTIYAVQESPLREGLIWVGANDGPVHVTRDGGQSWQDVTPADLPPGGRVQTVEPSPHDPARAYIAVYRYLLDDWQPYIYRTEDYGKSWTRLTDGENGIPADDPTWVIREDPRREGLLFAGTEFGMYLSFDDGAHWQPFQLNLPIVPVTDIKIFRNDLVLSTMGRSFWILDDLSPVRQFTPKVTELEAYLFAPAPAFHMRYRTPRGGGTTPEYPPPGAWIDYYCSRPVSDLELEVFDDAGDLIRSLVSGQAGEKAAVPKTAPGLHRLHWDLRQQGIPAPTAGRSIRGPMVSPGTYRLRLRVGGRSMEREMEVRMDPRIEADGVTRSDLQAQEFLSLQIRDAIKRGQDLAGEMSELRGRLAPHPQGQAGSPEEKLAELYSQLVTAEGPYPQPMLIDQLRYLYSMLDRADQRPGRDAYRRFEELHRLLSQEASAFQELRRKLAKTSP